MRFRGRLAARRRRRSVQTHTRVLQSRRRPVLREAETDHAERRERDRKGASASLPAVRLLRNFLNTRLNSLLLRAVCVARHSQGSESLRDDLLLDYFRKKYNTYQVSTKLVSRLFAYLVSVAKFFGGHVEALFKN